MKVNFFLLGKYSINIVLHDFKHKNNIKYIGLMFKELPFV